MHKANLNREVWQRGPVAGVPPLLQPVAHALLQAKEEVHELMHDFPRELLWEKPAGLASPSFHLQHIAGVISRLFTYAKAMMLTPQQLEELATEGKQEASITLQDLLAKFDSQISLAIEYLKTVDENSLGDFRGVGRAQLPSTVIGLLVHAAEHTMRHLGQLLVTVRVLKGKNE